MHKGIFIYIMVIFFPVIGNAYSVEAKPICDVFYAGRSAPQHIKDLFSLQQASAIKVCSVGGIQRFFVASKVTTESSDICRYVLRPAFRNTLANGKSVWSMVPPPSERYRQFNFTFVAPYRTRPCPLPEDERYIEVSDISNDALLSVVHAWGDFGFSINKLQMDSDAAKMLKSWFSSEKGKLPRLISVSGDINNSKSSPPTYSIMAYDSGEMLEITVQLANGQLDLMSVGEPTP